MYRDGSSGGGRFVITPNDFSAAIFLDNPRTIASTLNRTYVNSTVLPGQSYQFSLSQLAYKRYFGMVFQLVPANDWDALPSQAETITIRVVLGGAIAAEKTVPFSSTVGFSIFDVKQWAFANAEIIPSSVAITITNSTSKEFKIMYVTPGPLVFYNHQEGLVDCSCGEELGSDEYFPQYGVIHMHGALKVKDINKRFLGLLSSPSSYGISWNVARLSLRTEIYVGTQMAALMETDEFSFSVDGKEFEVSLKDILLEMDSIYVTGPRLINLSNEQSMRDVLRGFFAFENSAQSEVLSPFNFFSVSDNFENFRSGPIILAEQTTLLGFLNKLGQATLTHIGINHVIVTSMQYSCFVYGNELRWSISRPQPVSFVYYTNSFYARDLLGEIEYTPLKKNYIDKISYDMYQVGLSDSLDEYTITYDLIDVNSFKGGTAESDKAQFFAYWSGKSRSAGLPANNPNETTYGMRMPRPSDVSYDSANACYVADYAELEKSEARALTRGFRWRFSFLTEFSGNEFAKANLSAILSNVDNYAQYGGPASGVYSNSYLMFPRQLAFSFPDYVFYYRNWNGNRIQVRANNTLASKMFWISRVFDNMASHYTLHFKLPSGVYLVDGQTYTKKQYFSYWYTHTFGLNPWRLKSNWSYDSREWTPLGDSWSYGAYGWNSPTYQDSSYDDKISSYITLMATANMKTSYVSNQENGYYNPSGGVFNTYNYGDPYTTTYQGSSVYQVGMNNDIDGGYGADNNNRCFNVNDSVGSGEQTIWPKGGAVGADGKPWYHSNFGGSSEDYAAKADADYICVTSNVTAETLVGGTTKTDNQGSFFIEGALPSSDTLRQAITDSQDNFLSKYQKEDSGWTGTEDRNNPGLYFSQYCNAYCTFWSVSGLSSLQDRVETIKQKGNVSSDFRWCNPRPSFGFCVKGVKYGLEGRFAKISKGDTFVKQFNAANQYNYTLTTNELISSITYQPSSGSPWVLALDRALSVLSSRFSNGRTVYWLKGKIWGTYQESYIRNHYLNDIVSGAYPVSNGSGRTDVFGGNKPIIQAIEYVMQEGDCYVNLRLME